MRTLKKIKNNIELTIRSLFWGMKGANEVISTSHSDSSEIIQEKGIGGVFNDLLQNKETQEVKECRDAYYRILKEADNYTVNFNSGFKKETTSIDDEYYKDNTITKAGELGPEECGDISVSITRKSSFERNMEGILQTKGYKVEVIQDRKTYENDMDTRMKEAALGMEINDPRFEIFTIERDFCPRFAIEFFIQKLIIKKTPKGKRLVDLYFSIYPRQFQKTDALFIAEMEKIIKLPEYKSDIFDFETIEFITDKSYGIDSFHCFKFRKKRIRSISILDGHYIVSLEVDTLIDEDVTDKYKTKELDDKYQVNAPKKDGIDINTIIRHL